VTGEMTLLDLAYA